MDQIQTSQQAELFVSNYISEEYVACNKRILPIEEAYLYQSKCLSEVLNWSLRNGTASEKINQMTIRLNSALVNSHPLGKEIKMYRGFDRKFLFSCEIGAYLVDKAFNSVTPNQTVAEYFGDVILRIRFSSFDKLLFFGGKRFYHDTLEFLAPPNTCYQIVGKEEKFNKIYLDVRTVPYRKTFSFKLKISDFDRFYSNLLAQMGIVADKGQKVFFFQRDSNELNWFQPKELAFLYPNGKDYSLYISLQINDKNSIRKIFYLNSDQEVTLFEKGL